MNYQLLALDLDGTLTNSRKEITPSTRDALIDIQKNGKKVVLASGRPSQGVLPLAEELHLETMEVIFSPTTVVVSQTAAPVRSFTANIFQMMLRLRFLKS